MGKGNEELTASLLQQDPQIMVTQSLNETIRTTQMDTRSAEQISLDLEQETARAMQRTTEIMHQMGIEQIGAAEDSIRKDTLINSEIPAVQHRVDEKLQKKEDANKKEKEKKKNATRRAGNRYTPQDATKRNVMIEARNAWAEKRDNDRKADKERVRTGEKLNWRTMRVGLTGKEFVPDPSGQIDVAGVLEKQRLLRNQVGAYEEEKKAGIKHPIHETAVMETNKEILLLLNEALRAWFGSAGIEARTGKQLSNSKTNEAREGLALAIERYNEAMGNVGDTVGKKYVDQLLVVDSKRINENIAKYEEEDRNRAKNAFEDDLGGSLIMSATEALQQTRDLIAQNSERYLNMKEKAQVDRIFKEHVATVKKYSEVSRYSRDLIANVRVASSGIENKVTSMANKYIVHEKERAEELDNEMKLQREAIRALLTGHEADSLIRAVKMKERWGISSELIENAEKEAQFFTNIQQYCVDNVRNEVSPEELQIRQEYLDTLQNRVRELHEAHERDPENEIVNGNLESLRVFITRGEFKLQGLILLLGRITNDQVAKNLIIGRDNKNKSFTYTTKDEQGNEIKVPYQMSGNFVINTTRDLAENMVFLYGDAAISDEVFGERYDRLMVLKDGRHTNRDESGMRVVATEAEYEKALRDEYQEIELAEQRVNEVLGDRMNKTFDRVEAMRSVLEMSTLHSQIQALSDRSTQLVNLLHGKGQGYFTDEERENAKRFFLSIRSARLFLLDFVKAGNAPAVQEVKSKTSVDAAQGELKNMVARYAPNPA